MTKRVLVVDDDPDTLVYLSSYLEDHGYELATAGDAAEALAVLEGFRPDAMLVDVMMPGRSGLDLLVRLRQSPQWRDLPVLVVTGNDHLVQDEFRSYLASHDGVRGPDGVVAKPIDLAELLALVDTVTGAS